MSCHLRPTHDSMKDELLKHGVVNTITMYGSARHPESNDEFGFYARVRNLFNKIAKTFPSHGLITGGGPGLMEAANRGAQENGMKSIGVNILLPFEQEPNRYIDDGLCFESTKFYRRKPLTTINTKAYVICPGGFGTMDEMFELLTLMQTLMMDEVPIIIYDLDGFGEPIMGLINWMVEHGTISEKDLDLLTVTKKDEEVLMKLYNQLGDE